MGNTLCLRERGGVNQDPPHVGDKNRPARTHREASGGGCLGETLFVLLPLLLTLLFTVATCLALDIPLNLANVVALPLVLGLGIAFGIYLILRMREAGSRSIVRVLRSSTSQAVLFSVLTTMASFGALGFSPHPGMASLGILLVVVLILALVCALVILPALLAELEQR